MSLTPLRTHSKRESQEKTGENTMSCERCGGFMVFDTFCDPQEKESPLGFGMTRCLNCGNLEDTIILTNRARSPVQTHRTPIVFTQRN